MNTYWFTIILYFLKYWSWPLTTLFLVLFFNSSIKSILSHLTGIKVGNFNAEINQAAKLTADAFPGSTSATILQSSVDDVPTRIGKILISWNSVEDALSAAVKRKFPNEIPFTRITGSRYIKLLSSKGLLTPKQVVALRETQMIRNNAVHNNRDIANLDSSDIEKYIAANQAIIETLNAL